MKKILPVSFLLTLLIILAGCTSQQSTMPNVNANWTIYPFYNNTDKSEAADQVQRLLAVQAPASGFKHLELPPDTEVSSANTALSQAHRIQSSRQWARQHDIEYALTGTIDQWEIREDGKPVVSLTMNVINVRDHGKLLTTSSRSEGRVGDDLYKVAQILLQQMLAGLPMTQ